MSCVTPSSSLAGTSIVWSRLIALFVPFVKWMTWRPAVRWIVSIVWYWRGSPSTVKYDHGVALTLTVWTGALTGGATTGGRGGFGRVTAASGGGASTVIVASGGGGGGAASGPGGTTATA